MIGSAGSGGYRAIAAALREQITSGAIEPGALLPSVRTVSETYGVNKETASRAFELLRREGRLVSDVGAGYRARVWPERQPVAVPRGARVIARPPLDDAEREELGLDDAEHVVVLTVGGRERARYGADHVELRFS